MDTNANEIYRAVKLIGGYEATAKVCGKSAQAVMKWVKNGKLPRTEATGETRYAEMMAKAHPQVSKAKLLATVLRPKVFREEHKQAS